MLLEYFDRKMGQNMGIIWAKTDHEHIDRDIS